MDVARAPRFDPERARRLEVPLPLWKELQQGQTVGWDGRTVSAEQILGPPRRGLAFAYVTDTRPTPAMVDQLRDVDLLVCEGTYGDATDLEKAKDHRHMTFAEAATLARQASARSLLLTHFSPAITDPAAYLSNATKIFEATTIGTPGLEITLAFDDEVTSGESEPEASDVLTEPVDY
jgi:ribonuclease Z